MVETKRQKTMSLVVFGIYSFLLIWLILFKLNTNLAELDHIRSVNLIPYKGSVIVNGRELKEIIYNVLVFIPLGMYISILKNGWSFWKKVVSVLCVSVIFEIFQFIFAIGASDITDVIGNTLGGIIGIACYMLFKKAFKNKCITIINSIGLAAEVLAIAMISILFAVNM